MMRGVHNDFKSKRSPDRIQDFREAANHPLPEVYPSTYFYCYSGTDFLGLYVLGTTDCKEYLLGCAWVLMHSALHPDRKAGQQAAEKPDCGSAMNSRIS